MALLPILHFAPASDSQPTSFVLFFSYSGDEYLNICSDV